MSSEKAEIRRDPFFIGAWRIDPIEGRVSCGERITRLEPKVMQVLLCLAEQNGQIADKQLMQEKVWDGRIVSDEAIHRCISKLRRAFDDSPVAPRYIETAPKRGYRLLQLPQMASEKNAPAAASAAPWTIGSVPAGIFARRGKAHYALLAAAALMSIGVLFGVYAAASKFGGADTERFASSSDLEQSMLNRAAELFKQRNPQSNDRAIAVLKSVVSEHPLAATGYYELANAYAQKYASWTRDLNDISEALTAAARAVQLDDTNPNAQKALGVARSFMGDYEGALDAFEKSLALQPNQWAVQTHMGSVYYKLQDYEIAENYFKRALSAAPTNLYLYKKLGAVNMKMHRLSEAEHWYHKMLAAQPLDDYASARLTEIALQRGETEKAKWQCQSVLAQSRDHKNCALMFGKTLIAAGEFEAAYGHFSTQPPSGPKLAKHFETYQLIAEIRTGRRPNAHQDIIDLLAEAYDDDFLSANDRSEIKQALSQATM